MSRLGRLNRGETNIDFQRVWRRTLVVSALLLGFIPSSIG